MKRSGRMNNLHPGIVRERQYLSHRARVRRAALRCFDTTLEGRNVPFPDAVVSRSGDGKRIYIKAVNTNHNSALKTSITLKGVRVAPLADVETVTGETLATFNSFATPEAINIKCWTLKPGPDFTIELPKHSASVITLYAQ